MTLFQSTEQPFPPARLGRPEKYPFSTLDLHEGFTISAADAPQFESFKVYVHQRNKVLKKVFRAYLQANGDISVWRAL
jgi:hypothetical protein